MTTLAFDGNGAYRRFHQAECEQAGERLADEYRRAEPFPHIVIDDFLDRDVLRHVAANYPSTHDHEHFDRDQERFKYQFRPAEIDDPVTLNLLSELNSEAFLAFLEKLTGIEGLIPDPHFVGGGLHLTRRGGHLGIHADFNLHKQLKLERRLNLLVYLNEDWDEAWGGGLELWDKKVTACQHRVAPHIGRALIFNTTLDSFHGHPDALACPETRDRRSIAIYYYTAIAAETVIQSRNTNFRPRPATADRRDLFVSYRHFVSDWVPPKLQPLATRLNPFSAPSKNN